MMNGAPSQVTTLYHSGWTVDSFAEVPTSAAPALERGDVLFFPGLAFNVEGQESQVFSPSVVRSAKQVAFDPATGRIVGTALEGDDLRTLSGMLARYSRQAIAL